MEQDPCAEATERVDEVGRRGQDATAGRSADRVFAELAQVHVAHEELRAAKEQMEAQQVQISLLLLQHAAERRWREQMAALVSLGLCVTDGEGTIFEANPPLAAHLGAALHRLGGQPLTEFLATEDVPAFRRSLRALGSGSATEHSLPVTLVPRQRAPERVHLFGFPEATDDRGSVARIQWVLVPAPDSLGHRAVETTDRSERTDSAPEAAPISATDVIGLAGSLAALSALPVGDLDPQRLLTRMAGLLRGAVPAADWVSIALGPSLEPQRLATSSGEAQTFDGWQVQAGEGPCLDAHASDAVVVTDDVTDDARWPGLARLAAAGPVHSVLALPLRDGQMVIGNVNIYSGARQAFDAPARRIAELAAAAVGGILQNVADRAAMRALADNLERALTSRAVIDQAKGMIMARLEVDADDAFARLVHLSSRLNVKVRDLATRIVEGHVDPRLRAAE